MAFDPNDPPSVEPVGRRSIPGTVFAAGVLWIIYGVLQIGGALLSVALTAQAGNPNMTGNLGCSLLFGIAFAYVGYQSVTGKAKDTLGNGLGSLLLGLLAGGVIVFALSQANLPPTERTTLMLTAGLSVGALVIAGILALVGRADYRAYRAEQRRNPSASRP